MQIVVAGQKLAVPVPDDLDAKVIAATGCSADELAASLISGPSPSLIAELLHPCLSGKDVPAKPVLSALIAKALGDDPARTIAMVRSAVAPAPKRSGS